MSRAERRRADKQAKKSKVATYNYTKEQLDTLIRAGVQAEVETIRANASREAIDIALTLMLALPLTVLKDKHWKKSAKKRLPKFLNDVIKLYEGWDKGEISLEDLRADLWTYGGIQLEVPKNMEEM